MRACLGLLLGPHSAWALSEDDRSGADSASSVAALAAIAAAASGPRSFGHTHFGHAHANGAGQRVPPLSAMPTTAAAAAAAGARGGGGVGCRPAVPWGVAHLVAAGLPQLLGAVMQGLTMIVADTVSTAATQTTGAAAAVTAASAMVSVVCVCLGSVSLQYVCGYPS